MRTDLNMRKGKMIAQGAHASMKVILDAGRFGSGQDGLGGCSEKTFELAVDHDFDEWLNGNFKKICLGVSSEAELVSLYGTASSRGLHCALIIDSGLTEFNNTPTITCAAIGPASSDEIDAITGHLKLL